MPAEPDTDLLHEWLDTRRDAAFRRLVERHAPLVWGAALRKTGNPSLAEDVVQEVFTTLARKAAALASARRPLAPWLHRCAVHQAARALRRESRHSDRMKRYAELEAGSASPDPWALVGPHLDEALDSLGETDRRVVLLHWFERRSFAEVAAELGCTPAAAQRRGHRALEKLASALKRRGAGVTVPVLAAGLTTVLAPPVPAAVLSSASAVAATAPAAVSSLSTVLHAMASAKLATAAAFVIAAAVPVSVQWAATPDHTASSTESAPRPAAPPPPGFAGKRPLDLSVIRAALDKLLADPDDYETRLHLRRLMFSLSAAELPAVLRLINDSSGNPEPLSDVVHALFARWAELDGPAATDAARATGKRFGWYPLRGAFVTWSAADLGAAWSWLEMNASDAMEREFLGGEALATQVEMGRNGADVMARADAVTDAAWRKALRYWVMRAWAMHGAPRTILEWALALPESPEREERIARTIEQLGEAHPDAFPFVAHLGNPARRAEVAHNILWPYLLARNPTYHVSPPDFVDDMANLTTAYPPDLFRDPGDALARHGTQHAMAKLAELPPGEARDEFVRGMLRSASFGEAREMLPALPLLAPEALVRSGELSHFTRTLTTQDPRAAAEWIASLPAESTLRQWTEAQFQSVAGKSTADFLQPTSR